MKLRSDKIAPMKFSQKWCVIVVLLIVFAATVSFFGAQTEESPTVNVSSSSEVQSESKDVQSRSDEPEPEQPTLASNSNTTPEDVGIERRFNELRRELLDDRAKSLNWWLAVTAIFLTFLAIIIPIAAFIGGRFSIKKLNEIKEEAQSYLKEIKKRRDEADSHVKGMTAEVAGTNPDKASEVVENVQQNPESSLIDRAVAAALSLQQQIRIDEAIEKWRAIALIAEESDNDLGARAWFSVGYLLQSKDIHDPNAAIDAYNKTLHLGPINAPAYYNRGLANRQLNRIDEARKDFKEALKLARKTGIEDLIKLASGALENLGRNDTR